MNGDDRDWPKWIDFVLLAYRSIIQSSTKYTPYELMFGRTMNTFERWSDEPSNDEVAAVAQRAAEIRKLHEETIPNALENINKAQEIQKTNQDKQSGIIEEPLKVGIHVFLKVPSLILGKLEPRYRGPYIIDSKTNKGNYYLKNKTGNVLSVAYPLSKLKIVKESVGLDINEVFIGIEKIKKD